MSKKKTDNGAIILDGVTKEIWDRAHELCPDKETAIEAILYYILNRRGLVVDDIMFFSKETRDKYLAGEHVDLVDFKVDKVNE